MKRKVSTSASKYTATTFEQVKTEFLDSISDIVKMENIPCELILNSDQTGVRLVPSCNWTMDNKGVKRVSISGIDDKRQITLVLCGSMIGDFLPPQLIYKGKTKRSHPKTSLPRDWNVTHTGKHWSNKQTTIEYIKEIIIPHVKSVRELHGHSTDKPALLIPDNFKGQSTDDGLWLLESNNIFVCFIPPNCTDRLQPMDLSVNKVVKNHLREKFESWYADQVTSAIVSSGNDEIQPIKYPLPLMRELGAKWLMRMHEYIKDNPEVIVNGFLKAGIPQALSSGDSGDDQSDCESIELFDSNVGDDSSSVFAYDTDTGTNSEL